MTGYVSLTAQHDIGQDDMNNTAHALMNLPVGSVRRDPADRFNKFTKTARGDWADSDSTPTRFTSHDLALMGVSA